jgi:hypothetical protein
VTEAISLVHISSGSYKRDVYADNSTPACYLEKTFMFKQMEGAMKQRHILGLLIFLWVAAATGLQAQFSAGADVVSRYIWRGTDFGQSAAVQPALAYTYKDLEVGAWGSYSLSSDGAGANENDLYISYTVRDFTLAVADYYFPAPGVYHMFEFDPDSTYNLIEVAGSYTYASFSILAAAFVSGDIDAAGEKRNSIYLEAAYDIALPEEVSLCVFLGAGNEMYVSNDKGDFGLVNLGCTLSKGMFSTSLIFNPEAETRYLVFAASF